MPILFQLEKPDLSKFELKDIISKVFDDRLNVKDWVYKSSYPEYLYWDKVKHIKFDADQLSQEEVWYTIKTLRALQSFKTPIKSEDGKFFTWNNDIPGLEEFFHELDLNTGGSLFSFTNDIDEKNKNMFITRGILEEAIASSQLEGANTTRKMAKQFIREGRSPKNIAEQMILNNYNAMQGLETRYKNTELTEDVLFELHAMIVNKTVKESETGCFRKDEDEIVVTDKVNQDVIYHIPPKMKFVNEEIQRLLNFANDADDKNNQSEGTRFLHPVIKAIILHFWIGYLHPFTDGNGRLARLLFYWYLLKNDYWAFAYLPISQIIKNSPAQYRNAYVYSEQDDHDLTYFIVYNISKIKHAVDDFRNYLVGKSKENKKINRLGKDKYSLNDRQIRLLQYYREEKDASTTPKTYVNINNVSKKTGLTDLQGLERLGFLYSKKAGRNNYYYATDKIKELFD